jgi:HSP20 family protein
LAPRREADSSRELKEHLRNVSHCGLPNICPQHDISTRAKSIPESRQFLIEEVAAMAQDPRAWMWSEAVEMLARAERLHRQFFQPQVEHGRHATWEPPVDVIETEREILVLAALPGVDPDEIKAAIDEGALEISGQRTWPAALRDAVIHRLELPQGRFFRRVALPPGRYDSIRRAMVNGCLFITLRKAGELR